MKKTFTLIALVLLAGRESGKAAEPGGSELEAALSLRGQRVAEVQFLGAPLAENARSKFLAMQGQDFSPSEIRSVLSWYHESGGDGFVQVRARKARNGVALSVEARQRAKIARIVFAGNKATAGSVLLQQIDLREGSEFEPESAKAAMQKISLFYSKQGYLASDVKFEFDGSSRELRFLVTEGEPTLLAGIVISPMVSVERKDLRARYERELLEAFGMKLGQSIQRDRVLDGIQAIKDWLREHDFLMAKDPVLDYKVAEDGKVSISLGITYGQRIRYGFRGNKQFSYRELLALVSEVKEVSSGSDYLASVRRRVLEAYKEIGFANARITTLVREDPLRGIQYVSLVVSEGRKIRIESIGIEGVFSMSKEEAEAKLESLGTRLVQRGFYDEAGVSHAAELFAERLKASGYLSAKFEFVKPEFNQDRSKVKISILFNEGIQTRLASADIQGARSFPPSEVKELLGLREGEPFNIFAFEQGLQALKERYRELGNLSAQITNEASDSIVRYSKDNSEVFIHVEVDEGPVFKVGEIMVRGNKKTHARVVLRELPFISGDLLTSPLLNESEDNLQKLNLFSSAIVRPIDKPGTDDVKDILILVEELDPGTFDIVPGFRNDQGLRLGFELGYQNLGGWNRSVNASAVFNRRFRDYYNRGDEDWRRPEYQFSLGFREPYLANWRVALTSNLNFLRKQYKSFDAAARKFTTGLKRDLTRHLSSFVEYGYEQVKIDHVRYPYDPAVDERMYFIGTVTPGLMFDSRNEPFNPSKGIYSVNRLEVASRWFGSEVNVAYYRATSHNSTYMRLFGDVVLALALNMGWERSNAAGQPIPSYKLFRLGGLGSVRGYNEDELEVDNKRIFGTLGSINYRGELRVPLSGNFGTALFLDAGNLMVDRESLSPSRLRSSVGTGLRYKTPVGPVLLDFAWRLQSDPLVGDTCVTALTNATTADRQCRKGPTDRYKVHFAIGVF